VSGNGKGATMLIADDNVETAVVAVGNVRISDLTIVNSKPGGAKTVGVEAYVLTSTAALTQLHDVAIHVSGAATNVGILKRESLEILDSEITAVGQNATGISAALGASLPANVTLERSYVSAARGLPSPTLEIPPIALDEPLEQAGGARIIRLFDSHLFGDINFVYNDTPQMEESLLEVIQTEIVGDVRASNRRGRVVITGSSIKGNFSDYGNRVITQNQVLFSDTYLEGDVHLRTLDAVLDTVGIHGLLLIAGQKGSVRSSYIYSEHAAGAMLIEANVVRMEQTFVQGAPFAVGVTLLRRFEAFSSVLVGTVAGHPTAVLSCTDTYGADYDLLDAACQPPQP
jgi:hypothetical protein